MWTTEIGDQTVTRCTWCLDPLIMAEVKRMDDMSEVIHADDPRETWEEEGRGRIYCSDECQRSMRHFLEEAAEEV